MLTDLLVVITGAFLRDLNVDVDEFMEEGWVYEERWMECFEASQKSGRGREAVGHFT